MEEIDFDDSINFEEVEYEQFPIIDGNMSRKLEDKMHTLLTIYSEGNVIYICHPKELLQYLVEDKRTKEIICVDWDDIDISKMFSSRNYEHFSIAEQIFSSGLINRRYIERKGFDMMRKYLVDGHLEYVYPFVVLEEIDNRVGPNEYFVRGIICRNQDGYQIAFNPQFCRKIPRYGDVFEKLMRLRGKY